MCDTSDYAIGVVLGQRIGSNPHAIYYASMTLNRDGHRAGLVRPEPEPFYFFGSRLGSGLYGSKIFRPRPGPYGSDGSRILNGSLMSLIQSLFDLSKLNLFRVFLYFCKQLIIVLQTVVRVHEIQIQNNY